jgi:hypothetical protein
MAGLFGSNQDANKRQRGNPRIYRLSPSEMTEGPLQECKNYSGGVNNIPPILHADIMREHPAFFLAPSCLIQDYICR